MTTLILCLFLLRWIYLEICHTQLNRIMRMLQRGNIEEILERGPQQPQPQPQQRPQYRGDAIQNIIDTVRRNESR